MRTPDVRIDIVITSPGHGLLPSDRTVAERLTKPDTGARRKLTQHLEAEYRRSIRGIRTPGFVARDAELKKLGM